MICPLCSHDQAGGDSCAWCGASLSGPAAPTGAAPENERGPVDAVVGLIDRASKSKGLGLLLGLAFILGPCALGVLWVLWKNSHARADIPPPLRAALTSEEKALRAETAELRKVGGKVRFGGVSSILVGGEPAAGISVFALENCSEHGMTSYFDGVELFKIDLPPHSRRVAELKSGDYDVFLITTVGGAVQIGSRIALQGAYRSRVTLTSSKPAEDGECVGGDIRVARALRPPSEAQAAPVPPDEPPAETPAPPPDEPPAAPESSEPQPEAE